MEASFGVITFPVLPVAKNLQYLVKVNYSLLSISSSSKFIRIKIIVHDGVPVVVSSKVSDHSPTHTIVKVLGVLSLALLSALGLGVRISLGVRGFPMIERFGELKVGVISN